MNAAHKNFLYEKLIWRGNLEFLFRTLLYKYKILPVMFQESLILCDDMKQTQESDMYERLKNGQS